MKFLRINIRSEIKLVVLFVLAFSAIAFVERTQDYKKIQELNIMIHDEGNNYFLSKEEISNLITADNSDFIIGSDYADIDLKAIENRVRQHEYVSTTQAFKDLSGNLTIEISLCKPIARIIRPDKPDSYICESGKVISTSDKYTPRVLLISGNYRVTLQRLRRALLGRDAWLLVLNSRGINVWCASAGGHLSNHDVITALRSSGVDTGGPASFSQADRQAFANQLDRLLVP